MQPNQERIDAHSDEWATAAERLREFYETDPDVHAWADLPDEYFPSVPPAP